MKLYLIEAKYNRHYIRYKTIGLNVIHAMLSFKSMIKTDYIVSCQYLKKYEG